MKKNNCNEKSVEAAKLKELSNKDLRDKYLQTRKAIEEHPFNSNFDKSEKIPEGLMLLLRREEIYSNELKKRELLEWALSSLR